MVGNGSQTKTKHSRVNTFNNIYCWKKPFAEEDSILPKQRNKRRLKTKSSKRVRMKLLFLRAHKSKRKKTILKITGIIRCILFTISTIILPGCISVPINTMELQSLMKTSAKIFKGSI
jgi:hypothetical protein